MKFIGGFTAILFATLLTAQTAVSYTFDSNVPKDLQQQITSDLGFMGTIQGTQTSALHSQIFGPLAGASYKKFFESRVVGIGMNSCGSANAVACVIPFMNPKKMFITQNYIKFSHPQVARMLVVYHEARHTESASGNWAHANCPTPFLDEKGNPMKSIWTGASLAGEAACDVTPLGSYGSSAIMIKNISKYCDNCSQKVKMDAGIYADDQVFRVTDASAKDAIRKDLYTK